MDEQSQIPMPEPVQISKSVSLHDQIAQLAACGVNSKAISESTGLTLQQVKMFLEDDKMRFEVKRLQHKFFQHTPKKHFQVLAEKAIEVTRDLMETGVKDSTKLKAATEVLDRAFGKAEQTINHEGSLIRRLFEQMDGSQAKAVTPVSQSPKIIDVEPRDNPNEVEKKTQVDNPNLDMVDSWVDKHL